MRTNWITRRLYAVARSLGMGKPMAHLKSVNLLSIQPNGSGRIEANGEVLYVAKIGGRYYLGTFERAHLNGDTLLYVTEECFWLGQGNWQKLWEFIDD